MLLCFLYQFNETLSAISGNRMLCTTVFFSNQRFNETHRHGAQTFFVKTRFQDTATFFIGLDDYRT